MDGAKELRNIGEQQKPWVKLDPEEKIERMRDFAKDLQQSIFSLRRENTELKNKLFQHRHGENGELIQKMKEHDNIGLGSISGMVRQKPEEVYF